MILAKELAKGFLVESIAKIISVCTPDVDFYDYDETLEQFNFVLTKSEIDMLARLMLEMYFEKDMVKLTVATNILSSQDLKYVFSGWNERNSFMSMFSQLQKDNLLMVKRYVSKDRLTGQRKFPTYEL